LRRQEGASGFSTAGSGISLKDLYYSANSMMSTRGVIT
jgi:hypothetical protein